MERRPVGLTVIALLLAWQALASAWSAALLLRDLVGGFGVLLFPLFRSAAGAAAAVTAVALWRRRRWAARAYVVWAVLTLVANVPAALLLGLAATEPSGERLRSWWWVLPTTALLLAAGLLYVGWRYVRRQVPAR